MIFVLSISRNQSSYVSFREPFFPAITLIFAILLGATFPFSLFSTCSLLLPLVCFLIHLAASPFSPSLFFSSIAAAYLIYRPHRFMPHPLTHKKEEGASYVGRLCSAELFLLQISNTFRAFFFALYRFFRFSSLLFLWLISDPLWLHCNAFRPGSKRVGVSLTGELTQR